MNPRRGASLAEVALGTFIFAVFSLAILALLVRSKQLDTTDKTMSQVNSLSEALMEEVVMSATGPVALPRFHESHAQRQDG